MRNNYPLALWHREDLIKYAGDLEAERDDLIDGLREATDRAYEDGFKAGYLQGQNDINLDV